jgi:type III secretion system FlhB-like substrate exporter
MRRARHTTPILKGCEGKGALGCLFTLVLLGAAAFVGIKAGPPYFTYKSLESDVKTEVSRAGAHVYGDDIIVENILAVAKKDDVPLRKDDIKVDHQGGQLQVTINYSVPVDFVLVATTLNFEIKASSFLGTL